MSRCFIAHYYELMTFTLVLVSLRHAGEYVNGGWLKTLRQARHQRALC